MNIHALTEFSNSLISHLDHDYNIIVDGKYQSREEFAENWIKKIASKKELLSEDEITSICSDLTLSISKNLSASKALGFHIDYIQPIYEFFKQERSRTPVTSFCPECNEEWIVEENFWKCIKCRNNNLLK